MRERVKSARSRIEVCFHGRSVASMSLLHRARATLSLHVAAALIGVRASTLRMWTEVGAGPNPDARGVYRFAAISAWTAEMSARRAR